MSIKIEKPFNLNPTRFQKNIRLKTPVLTTISPYQTYTRAIQTNAKILSQKYPHKSQSQLQILLQELQNDVETTIVILQGETPHIDAPCLGAQNHNNNQASFNVNNSKYSTMKSENSFLKKALYNLYNKYMQFKKIEKQQIEMINVNSEKLNSLNRINYLLSDANGYEQDLRPQIEMTELEWL